MPSSCSRKRSRRIPFLTSPRTGSRCRISFKLLPLVFISITVILANLPSFAASTPESEIFSSTTELQKLYRNELEIVRTLQEYANSLEKNLHVVQGYIDDFNKISVSEDEDATEIVENPVNAYHILKRTVIEWGAVSEVIKNHTQVEDLVDKVIKKGEQLPTFDDFIGGSLALVALQDTYALNLTEITHGALSNENMLKTSPYELSARDCLFMGKAAFNKGFYDKAIEWFQMALARSQLESQDSTIPTATPEEVQLYLADTIRIHDDILEKRGPRGETWQTFGRPANETLEKLKNYQIAKRYQPKIMVPLNPIEENENFKALCRGEYLRTPKLDAPLRCRYVQRPGGTSLLGPFKVEEYSNDPYIAMYHNFMADSEMRTFKETATSRLQRSLHQGRDGAYIATDIRTSKQAWLSSDDGPLIDKLSKRIGEATNLEVFPETVASEIYQVANYGMAGKYSPHTDYISGNDNRHNPLEELRGNRIATFMVYLEDVEAGGSTVFPLIGVQVRPVKGAAVFWWNLRTDGRGDPWTRHAGCSVLYGNKWITNKWIRYNDQFRKVPCVPEPTHKRIDMFQKLFY